MVKRKSACYECLSRPNVTIVQVGKFVAGRMVLHGEDLIESFEAKSQLFRNGVIRRISDPADVVEPVAPAMGVVEDDDSTVDPRSIDELSRLSPSEQVRLKKDVLVQIMLRKGMEVPDGATKQQLVARLAAERREND